MRRHQPEKREVRLNPTASRIPVPLLILLGTLTGIAPLGTDMYLAAFPQMTQDLGTAASLVQLTLSAFMAGLAMGQIIIGPLSDQWGRRRPLVICSFICVLATMGCALAPTVHLLIGLRFLMGFTGAAGLVLARSAITDLTEGHQTARYMNFMMMINGISPVLAPTLGGIILGFAPWRAVFWVLTVMTLVMAIGVFFLFPESLPKVRRHGGGLAASGRGIACVVRRPAYMAYMLAFVFSFGTLFSYISGSTYVLQNNLGLTATHYALVFAANSFGILAFSWVSNLLLKRFRPQGIGLGGIVISNVATLSFLVLALCGLSLVPTLVCLFVTAAAQGLVFGNATSLALGHGRDYAGASSALVGGLQCTMGGIVSPLVSAAGANAVIPMAAMMVGCSLIALVLFLLASRIFEPRI
ncbi:multidrug effflux MFS transporter [Kocuria sp. TGY1127_2]|uniref:multidrug effflux MFS transporter n=1 Tax=Kocuria sp. TGY1127_2 TaxID=2711328 RepID=UPI0015BD6428|nr:multidrug effflux MFS transporter [Kocuria sp. TGY1127_2]